MDEECVRGRVRGCVEGGWGAWRECVDEECEGMCGRRVWRECVRGYGRVRCEGECVRGVCEDVEEE